MSGKPCKYWDNCETCPLPECVLGQPGGILKVKRWGKKEEALSLHNKGMKPRDIAEELKIPLPTVYTYLRK